MKHTTFGIFIFILGIASAIGYFFYKNHSTVQPFLVLEGKSDSTKSYAPTSFSLDSAPSESLRGDIVSMSGEVGWQSRIATQASTLSSPVTIQQGETLTTGTDGQLEVHFASVSALRVGVNTGVDIVQTLPVNLVFNQSSGQSEYETLGTSPVSIRSLNLLVTVHSGIINVQTDSATGEVTLLQKTGSATVAYNSKDFISKVWELAPNETFVFDSSNRRGYFNPSL